MGQEVAVWQLQPGVSYRIASSAILACTERPRRSQGALGSCISGTLCLKATYAYGQRDRLRTVMRLMARCTGSDRTWVDVSSDHSPAFQCQKPCHVNGGRAQAVYIPALKCSVPLLMPGLALNKRVTIRLNSGKMLIIRCGWNISQSIKGRIKNASLSTLMLGLDILL